MPTEKITIEQACNFLKRSEDVLILSHIDPDGDTLGSAHALFHALRKLGKRARVACAETIPSRYDFMRIKQDESFAPKTIVAADVADTSLLGERMEPFFNRIDLCIDHHPSNREYANYLLLDAKAASTCEIMLAVIEGMGVTLDPLIADCLYTGIATDTGCFRYANTTALTHRAAGKTIEAGADIESINRLMFETVSCGRMALQSAAVRTLEYHFHARCALMLIARDSMLENQVLEDELEGLSALPRQIEGVEVGITLRELPERDGYKISMRTNAALNASAVCEELGGGGHHRAAGCILHGSLAEVKKQILDLVGQQLGEKQ